MEQTPDPGSIIAEPVISHTRGCCLQLHLGPASDIPRVPGPLLLHLPHEGIRIRASDLHVQQTTDHRAFAFANGRLITQLTFPPLPVPFPTPATPAQGVSSVRQHPGPRTCPEHLSPQDSRKALPARPLLPSRVQGLQHRQSCCESDSLVAQTVKSLPAMWETRVRSLGWEDPLEKGMATHSSILAWRIS